MKQYWIAFVVFAVITGGTFLGISCEPKAVSQGTVEINEVYTGSCPVTANIDGSTSSGNATTFGNGSPAQLYTFTNTVPPGDHTLNFSTGNTCSGGGCGLTGPDNSTPASSYPLTFYVGAGDIYEAYVSEGGGCSIINVGAIN